MAPPGFFALAGGAVVSAFFTLLTVKAAAGSGRATLASGSGVLSRLPGKASGGFLSIASIRSSVFGSLAGVVDRAGFLAGGAASSTGLGTARGSVPDPDSALAYSG